VIASRWRLRRDAALAIWGPWLWSCAALAGLGGAAGLALTQGAVALPALEIPAALGDPGHPLHRVVWDVRLPRVVCGAAVGASLAVAGALLQTVVRNPLADPGVLGVTAGAGVGALLTILIVPERSALVPWVAFAGGLASIAVILTLAWTRAGGGGGALRIVLSGVALQAVLFAALTLMLFAFADRAPAFVAFLVGSLNGLGWADAQRLAGPTALGLAAAWLAARPLDLLLLDDGSAGGLGMAVRRARLAASCLSALLAASAVSAAGLVGFVGLVVPNGVRLAVGPSHRALLPAAALAGAALVLVADALARSALAPLELPVGALLALVGGPYFLFVLWRKLP
jgi:iron complex transport system permease protein